MSGELSSARPLVSVIVAAYNAERYIAETLDSIRAQTFRNFEVIVVDDGSTDRTAQIVAGFPEVCYLRQDNHGAASARNKGILLARGSYVAFIDADDLWLPEKLEKQVNYLINHPEANWVYCDVIVFDSDTRRPICRLGDRNPLPSGSVLRKLFLNSFIASPTPLIRRKVVIEAGLFDETPKMRFWEDWYLWLRIAERHPIGIVSEPLALLRVHSASATQTTSAIAVYESMRRIIEQTVARNAASLQGVKARALAGIALSAGLRELRLGRGFAARPMFIKAIRETPRDLRPYVYLSVACLPSALLVALGSMAQRFRRRASLRLAPGLASLMKGRGLA